MKNYLILVLTVLLFSCANSIEKNYYKVEYQSNNTKQALSNNTKKPNIYLSIFKLASELDDNGILYQIGASKFINTQQNLWIQPLKNQLLTYTNLYLSDHTDKYNVVTTVGNKYEKRIYLDLINFNGRFDGKAIIAGKWCIINNNKTSFVPFYFEIEQKQNGYPALIKALTAGFDQALEKLNSNLM